MKKLIACALVCYAPLALSESLITPPNMALGYWITTVDQSDIIEKTLASLPESSRAMMREMMKGQIQEASTTEQCITEDTLNNFETQIKDSFSDGSQCEFKVLESSSEKFEAMIDCEGSVAQITTTVINAKRNETTVVSHIGGLGETKISSISEWQSSICP